MITIKKGKITVSSKTPRQQFGNREQRRASIYRNRRQRLVEKVQELRREMAGAGIKLPNWPYSMSRKVLSGHYGALCELAKS